MSEKSEIGQRVLNNSPAYRYRMQVCVGCKEFMENKGLCDAGPGDILSCLQIENLRLSTTLMIHTINSASAKCDCKHVELTDKPEKKGP